MRPDEPRSPRSLWGAYLAHDGPILAGAIAFSALLSVVPLAALGVTLLAAAIGSSDEAIRDFRLALQTLLPAGSDLPPFVASATHHSRGAIGAISVLGLLASGSSVFAVIEHAFGRIWGGLPRRGWAQGRLMSAAVAFLALLVLATSVGLSALAATPVRAAPAWVNSQVGVLLQARALAYGPSLIASILLFGMLYHVVPNCPVRRRSALAAGVIAGGAFEIAKAAFAVYLTRWSNYGQVYGSMASVVALMVWTYTSSVILLAGAEVAAWLDRRAGNDQSIRPRRAGDGRSPSVPDAHAQDP